MPPPSTAQRLAERFLGDRSFRYVACACVLLVVAIAYANALDAELLFDSRRVVLEDPRLRIWDWDHISQILTDDYWFGIESDLYRPFTTLSYAANYSLLGHGTEATGYVAVNIALHALNSILVVALARVLLLRRSIALFGGLLFAVHPLFTEAVTNVVGRADLLVATGVLAGTWFHHRALAAGGWLASVGVAVASAIAISSKESGIVLIGVLVLFDCVCGRMEGDSGHGSGANAAIWRTRLLRSYLWCLAAVAAYFAFRAAAIDSTSSGASAADNPLILLDSIPARVTAAAILLRYIGKILWPAELCADYSFDSLPLYRGPIEGVADVFAVASVAVVLAVILVAFAWIRRRALISFLVLFFFVTFAPVSNVFLHIGTILGERLVYLPAAGPVLLIAVGLGRVMRGKLSEFASVGVAVLLLGLLSWRTAVRNTDWYSERALFAAAVEDAPGSFKSRKSLAAALYMSSSSEQELRERIDVIIEHAEAAWSTLQRLPVKTGYAELLADLGLYYRLKGRLVAKSESAQWYQRSVAILEQGLANEAGLAPNWRLRDGLAKTRLETGEFAKAEQRFEQALALAPGPQVLETYARFLFAQQRQRDALLAAMRLLTLRPDHAGMWDIVNQVYAGTHPGEAMTMRLDTGWRFNTQDPTVVADLRAAAAMQYEAAAALGRGRGGEQYRTLVQQLLGFDPAAQPGGSGE